MKAFIFSLLIGFGVTASAAAEGTPAKFTENMQIVLPVDQPLESMYIIDIEGLFSDEAKAKQFFGMFTENVVHYVVHFEENTVEVHLHSYADPIWNLSQWNTYFEGRAAKMQAVYKSL